VNMAEHSEGRTDGGSGAASSPVFVDNSGGRRRRWRRLGWALGAAGGGYALVVAVSMIGGNSEAPWGVLIPGSGEGSGAARVVPEPAEDDGQLTPGAASGHISGEPRPGASDPAAVARFADEARVPRTSPQPAPGARASAGPDTGSGTGKAPAGGTKGSKGGATTGGSGGATPTPGRPSAEPTGGGAATGSTGAPTEPGTEPSSDPTASSGPSPQGGLLDRIVDQLGGGAATSGGAATAGGA
jgi:hypothetical protein